MSRNFVVSDNEVSVLNRMNRRAYHVGLGNLIRGSKYPMSAQDDADVYFVDSKVAVSGDGKSWSTAFKTIQEGANAARYVVGTTSIEGDSPYNSASYKARDKYVFIYPGQYNEQVLFSGYNIHLIGVGARSNGDFGVVINYDAAIASTAVVAFSGSGLEMSNICIVCEEAIPALLLSDTSDAVHIHDCWIKGDNSKTCTIGISCAVKNSLIEHNVINGCIAGINVAAGAWFHNTIVRDNKIDNVTNGIAIAATAVCTQSEISSNKVVGSSSSIVNAQATDVIISQNHVKPVLSDAGAAEGDNVTLS